jgi:anti-sigma factor RsiW
MAGPSDRTDEAALWRRWRSASAAGEAAAVEPDALLLAAYADGRLPEAASGTVEDWLAAHPEIVSDVLAARGAARGEEPAASDAVITRATTLVVAGDAQLLTFPQPAGRRASWRTAALWSGVAASLVVTSMIGFTLGSSAYLSLARSTPSALGQELFDPPTGLFNSLAEDPNT